MMRFAVFAAAVLAAAQAAAQQPIVRPFADPGAIQQREIDDARRRQDAERERRKPVADPLKVDEGTVTQPPQTTSDALHFMVREIRFTPSELLKPEELDAIAKDYRGRQLTFADLQGLVARVNALYKSKGIVTAQAVIPPQDVSNGIVRVRLVEGKVGKVNVEGNATTRENYVTSRLGLKPAELVDLDRLERAIVRYNRTNDTQMRAELKPGTEFGTTDVYVTLTEPERNDLRLSLDNSGSPSTGRNRLGLNYTNRSLMGFRDELTASTSQSDGHQGISAGYTVPFNIWGGRIGYGYYDDSTQIKHGPLQTLNITGSSTANILTVRQPLWVEERTEFDLLGGAKKRVTSNFIDSVFLQSTKTTDRSAGGEFQFRTQESYWLASFTRAWGQADVLGVTADYRIDHSNVRYTRDLPKGFSLRANYSAQASPQVLLPSSEQFFIGGEGSVRGYDLGAFAGDHGYTMNVELHHPLAAIAGEGGSQGMQATGFFFADYGKTYPFRPPNTGLRPYEQISSVGWGVDVAVGSHWYGRITLAYGLTELPLMPRPYSILFQAVASAF